MAETNTLVRVPAIANRIVRLRGQNVILDADLATLYGVSTKRLNEQARRNPGRFPPDFRFSLTPLEAQTLRSQFATSNGGRGGRRTPPWAYTEHGAIMAASVLNTARAVQVSVLVVRAFVRLRQMLAAHKDLQVRLQELERTVGTHGQAIQRLMATLRWLMAPARSTRRRIGFNPPLPCQQSRASRQRRAGQDSR